MTKWETVFTEVVAAMVSAKADEIRKDWLAGGLQTEAASICCMAAIIADEANKSMQTLQPLEAKS